MYMMMRRMSQDPDIAQHQLSPGVVWRVLRFAKPYRFLIAVLSSSGDFCLPRSGAAAAFQQIIDEGILQGDRQVVIILSVQWSPVWLCCRRCSTWFSAGFLRRSARLDLRPANQVFDHVIRCRSHSSPEPRPESWYRDSTQM